MDNDAEMPEIAADIAIAAWRRSAHMSEVLSALYAGWAGYELCVHPEREQYGGGCWGLLPWDEEGWLREPCVSCKYEHEEIRS